MYHRGRYKKTSMFNPSVALDRLPTYHQKKGMIIQRSTNLPSCPKITTQSDIKSAYKLLKETNKLPDKKVVSQIMSIPIDANENLLVELNQSYVLTGIIDNFNIPLEKIVSVYLDSFQVNNVDGSGGIPSVTYRWYYGESQFPVTSVSTTSDTNVSYVTLFDHPYVYEDSSNRASVMGPRLARNSSFPQDGFVFYSLLGTQTPTSTYKDVYESLNSGRTYYPWYEYQRGGQENFVHTQLRLDNSSYSDPKELSISLTIVYDK